MKRFLSLASISLGVALSMPAAAQTDWSIVDTILTRTGAVSGDVHRYGLPRSDLNVSLDGVAIKPGFALGGWVAFEPMGDKAMMMGDLVLTEAEINPVMSKLLVGGPSSDRPAQPLAARQSADVLHACRRDRRPGSARASRSHRSGGQ